MSDNAPNINATYPAQALTPSLWCLPLPVITLPPYDHTNSYVLLDANNRALVVDVGSMEAANMLTVWLEEHQYTLTGVLLTHTHSDHVAGLARLLEHHPISVPVYMHALEHHRLRQYLPNYPNVQHLADGDTLQHGALQLTCLHSPGHSPGHLSVVVRQPNQPIVIVAGDMVTGDGAIWVGTPEGDVSAYVQSVRRLQEIGADCLAASHGAVSWQPEMLLDKARMHKEAREQQLLAALESPLSLAELTAQLYANIPDTMRDFAERSLAAHLAKLLHEDRIYEQHDTQHDTQRGRLYQRHKLNP